MEVKYGFNNLRLALDKSQEWEEINVIDVAVRDIGVKNVHSFLIILGMVLTKEVEDLEVMVLVLLVEEEEEALEQVEVEEDL